MNPFCLIFEFLVVPKVKKKKKSYYPKTPIERTTRLRSFKKIVVDVLNAYKGPCISPF